MMICRDFWAACEWESRTSIAMKILIFHVTWYLSKHFESFGVCDKIFRQSANKRNVNDTSGADDADCDSYLNGLKDFNDSNKEIIWMFTMWSTEGKQTFSVFYFLRRGAKLLDNQRTSVVASLPETRIREHKKSNYPLRKNVKRKPSAESILQSH